MLWLLTPTYRFRGRAVGVILGVCSIFPIG
jgi:hypothetical protein